MATGTGGIATKADCNALAGKVIFSGDLTKCPTRAEIAATGGLVISGSYADNQCVKYSDLSQLPSLTISPTSYTAVIGGGSFTLNITSNTSWTISYPSWCSGTTSGSGNASITVYVGSNAGNPSRGGSITVRTTSGDPITKSCYVSQSGLPLYGGNTMFAVKFRNMTPYSRNVAGNVSLLMNGVNVGSFYVSGTVPANTSDGISLYGGEFDFSSVNKTIPINFGFTDFSGDSSNGFMEASASGNATADLGLRNWIGSPAGARYNGSLSYIEPGYGFSMIYAIFTITGIG